MPSNRKERRKEAAWKHRSHRPAGMGMGKHAENGNKFQHLHVNWHERVMKEMRQCKPVINLVLGQPVEAEPVDVVS